MPVKGRKPGATVPRHRHRPRHDWLQVTGEPFAGDVPKLPRRHGGWPARTKRKWAVWSVMPHCRLWSDSDWEFAIDTLELVAQFHEGNERLATEIRNRERVLGTTADYRRDLRIRYGTAVGDEDETPDVVPNLDDYRERMNPERKMR